METRIRPKILLVDDSTSYNRQISAILSHCEVDHCKTTDEALSRLQSGTRYRLALVNLNLTRYGEKAGREVLEYIQSNLPFMPRIVLTGDSLKTVPIRETFFDAGFEINELFLKGRYLPAELRKAVQNLLQETSAVPSEIQLRRETLYQEVQTTYTVKTREIQKETDEYIISIRREMNARLAKERESELRSELHKKKSLFDARMRSIRSRLMRAKTTEDLDRIQNDMNEDW